MARSGFEVQKVTVEALFLREIRTRFGKFRLGYLWAVAYLKRLGSHHQMARSGFEVQKVTVEALFLREIRTRFGKFRLGYLWAILEPSAHLLILF